MARRSFQIIERFVVGPLMLEGPEEPLSDRVIVAVTSAAHGTSYP